MVSFLILSLLIFHSVSDNLQITSRESSLERNSPHYDKFNDFNFFSDNSANFLSLKLQDDIICNENKPSTEIDKQEFINSAKISNEGGCSSISISHCTFKEVVVTDTSPTNNQMSIIYIKSINFILTDTTFTKCYSNCKISRAPSSTESQYLSLKSFSISDYVICHAIYLDENTDHTVKISNCNFLDNGINTETDGSIIYSNNVDNLQIDFTTFTSNTIFTRAIETYHTKNVELNFNSFNKMKAPKGQNGGALLVQFAQNVIISHSIFESNTLQLNDGETSNSNICGSAFFINLNDKLTFVNNTITKHETFLNSVIIFNKNEMTDTLSFDTQSNDDNLPIKRKVIISDSKFIQNSYSQTSDGNGIGFYVEDYSENLPDTDDGNSYIISIEFSGCSFQNNGNSDCSASVLEWTRKTSILSFSFCNFDSNIAPSGSSFFNIINGISFLADFCEVGQLLECGFLHFAPLTSEKPNSLIKLIEVSVTNSNFSPSDSGTAILSNFIMTEGGSSYNSFLNVAICTFTMVLVQNPAYYIINSKSNTLQVTDCKITFANGKKRFAIISDLNNATIEIIDCDFSYCVYAINLNSLAEKATIRNCNYLNCQNSGNAVIYGKSRYFFAENCSISNSLALVHRGIQIDQALNAEILNCRFENLHNSGIISNYDLESSSINVTSCTFTGTDKGNSAFYTKNKIVYFINNSVINAETGQGCFGFLTESIGQITIDKCKFLYCYNENNGKRGGAITIISTKEDVPESCIISNTEFIDCKKQNGIAYIETMNEAPQFINNVINSKTSNQYYIVIYVKQSITILHDNTCLFQNVSFIGTQNTANGGGGIGLWFQIQGSFKGDYSLKFENCLCQNTFWSGTNDKDSYGGGAISVESINCRNYDISIFDCSIYNSKSSSNRAGAISLVSNKNIQISNCYIESCSVVNENNNLYGGGIFVNQVGPKKDFNIYNVTINGSVSNSLISGLYYKSTNGGRYSISKCSFIDCDKTKVSDIKEESSIIQVEKNIRGFECIDTNFIFTKSKETNPRGIRLHCAVFKFENCYFCQCARPQYPFGGGIFYDEQANLDVEEKIDISFCTFEKCYSDNSAAIRLVMYNGLPSLYNNTFTDITSKYIVALIFKENVQFSHILLEKQKFIRCENLQNDGGGSGVWVSNHRADGNVYPTYIDFTECDFIENHAPNCGGGAFGIGYSTSVRPTQLNFEYCNFIGNECSGTDGGGAIWIRTSIPSFVSSCIFRDNRTDDEKNPLNGGAIYIRFTSSVPEFYISDSEFINNSCANSDSCGHAIFGLPLFSSLTIDNSQFIDNGVKENPNSIIYTSSYLQIYDSHFGFSNKDEKAFSRALYVGSNSKLAIYDSEFYNCSDPTGKAGAIFYEISPTTEPELVEISYCTFKSNTEGTNCCEMRFNVIDPPDIYGCTFENEDTTNDLIIIDFAESIDEMFPLYYYEVHGPSFINCNLHKNFFFNLVDKNGDHLQIPYFSMPNWQIISCTDFNLIRDKFVDLTISQGRFVDNENDNVLFPFRVDGSIRITDCVFNNNRVNVTGNTNETGIILVHKAAQTSIETTDFRNEEVEENGFVLKVNSSLELSIVTIRNCSIDSYSILMIIDENNDFSKSTFSMQNSFIDESGSIFFENRMENIIVSESIISNSVDGLIYKIDSNEDCQFSDSIQIAFTTFDNFSNCALYVVVFDEIIMTNNTLKNCQKNIEDDNSPLFEFDLRNNTKDYLCFEHFTFENNQFNNDNNRLMNGGGIGLFVTFSGTTNDKTEIDILINFIGCYFISNKASQCGGAYAFVEGNGGLVISNSKIYVTFSYKDCTFSKNSCNKLKGHALYIETSNVSIDNCVFDSHSLLDGDQSNNTPEEISQSSVVFITMTKKEAVSIRNCSFKSNKASSLYVLNCYDEIVVSSCQFESNDIIPLDSTIVGGDSSLISSSVITIVGAKEPINVEDCTFMKNSEEKSENSESGIVRSSTIFVSSESSFTMTDTNFLDNNINDLILNAYLDVSVTNCQFIELEKEKSIIGGALIINTKKKVTLADCIFDGYSSSVLKNEGNGNPTVLSPIQIISDDSIQITDITVGNVYGDVFKIKSKTSITVTNCVFDSNSSAVEKPSEKVGNYDFQNFFMTCSCDKEISMDSVSISNYEKALCFTADDEDLPFTRSINSPLAAEGGSSLKIKNFTFSRIKNAIFVNSLFDRIYLEKVVLSQCSNNQDEEISKDPIVGMKIFPSSSVVEVIFNEVKFENNEFSQNSEEEEVVGGSGLSITSDGSSNKKMATVQFNYCEFVSNCASGDQNSGGALHFTSTDDNLIFESLSFSGCLFTKNEAKSDTGALHITSIQCSSVTIINSIFTLNLAEGNYGAIYFSCSCPLQIDSCTFVNNSAVNSDLRTDSLFVSAFCETHIERSNFSKAVLMNEECGFQCAFENNIIESSEKLIVNDCLFSIVNPSGPQVMLASKSGTSTSTSILNSSFTHFFVFGVSRSNIGNSGEFENDEVNFTSGRTKLLNSQNDIFVSANMSLPFYHIITDSNAQVKIVDCCFDTTRTNALYPDFIIVHPEKDGEIGGSSVSVSVSFDDTVFTENKDVCVYPDVVNDLMEAIYDSNKDDGKDRERERDRKRRLLIIGLSAGAAGLVVIAVIVTVVIVVYKKKHKEMKQTIVYDDECQQKLEQEEFDFINSKYNPNEEIAPVKVNNVDDWYQSEKECEETDLEEFDL